MENDVIIKSIRNSDYPETRLFLNLEVRYNNNVYDWGIFCPENVYFNDFLTTEVKNKIFEDINNKEIIWENLEPKYREVEIMSNEVIQVPINKSEIVKPDIPDYYALRREAYPKIGDQLDALWKGFDSQEFIDMIEKINQIKQQFPKK